MPTKTKTKPKQHKPKQQPKPSPEPQPKADPRYTPVTGAPRARIVRVTVTEYWGNEYIPGRGKTYRIYAMNSGAASETIEKIRAHLHSRTIAAREEAANADRNTPGA